MKKASFQYIDDCFRNIKYGKDMTQSFVSIVNTLKREFNIKVSIDIVKNTSNVFFGMNIYPSINDLRRIADLMISDKTRSEEFIHSWNEIEEWCIEIDSLLFDDLGFDIEAGELTALLLHEIGHVIFSDEVPKTTLKVVKFNVLKRELMFRNLFKEGNVNGLIMSFPIIEACSNKSFSKKSLNNELNADEFVRKCGYGKELYTLIDKLIVNGQNNMVNKHIKEKEQDISIITNWSLDNINSLVTRKRKLYRSLKLEMIRNPSNYVKDIAQRLNSLLFKESKKTFINTNETQHIIMGEDGSTVLMDEQKCYENLTELTIDDIPMDPVIETPVVAAIAKGAKSVTRFFDKHNRIKPCKMRELDVIEVEIANIKNADDKMFILECLHDELDRVRYALDLSYEGRSEKVGQSIPSLMNYKNKVLKLINECKNTPIPKEQYGLFIKYPKGYEG